ncbi:trigger factor [Desulfovibrio sp. OttesenSCG-928-C06]|nr:trigger factor [Desulfovibrio sp. OttesenSCG-928-C06]
MQYKVEELAPLKKQIEITVPAADVDKQINSVAQKYRASVAVPGFRKGKAPLGIVEAQYHKDIYPEATGNMIDAQVRQILDELKLEAASKIEYKAENVVKGQDFTYSITFDVMPEFDLPEYLDIPVEEEEAEIDPAEVDSVLEMARKDLAELVPVEEKRAPRDGDVATLDIEAFDEEGKPIAGLNASGTDMLIGEKQSFEAFEALVKSVKVGEEKQDNISFPEDFPNPEFAGKEIQIKVKVNALNERKLPELNDEFAAKLGQYENLESVKNAITASFTQNRKSMARSAAQRKMLEGLLEKVDFPLPEALVTRFTGIAQANMFDRMRRQGKIEDMKNLESMQAQAKEEAEKHVKEYVFLNRVAKAENVEVSEDDMLHYIHQTAMSSRRSFEEVRDEYVNNNLLGVVHDRIMTDKALQAIYAKAKVTFVKAADKPAEEEKPKKKAATKKAAPKAKSAEGKDEE